MRKAERLTGSGTDNVLAAPVVGPQLAAGNSPRFLRFGRRPESAVEISERMANQLLHVVNGQASTTAGPAVDYE